MKELNSTLEKFEIKDEKKKYIEDKNDLRYHYEFRNPKNFIPELLLKKRKEKMRKKLLKKKQEISTQTEEFITKTCSNHKLSFSVNASKDAFYTPEKRFQENKNTNDIQIIENLLQKKRKISSLECSTDETHSPCNLQNKMLNYRKKDLKKSSVSILQQPNTNQIAYVKENYDPTKEENPLSLENINLMMTVLNNEIEQSWLKFLNTSIEYISHPDNQNKKL